MKKISLVLLILLSASVCFCATVKLPVTEDAGVSSFSGHYDDNSGRSVSLSIRQNQNWSGFETKAWLFRFDGSQLKGSNIDKAWVNFYLAKGELWGLGFSTVLADNWTEGGGVNGQTGRGGASWNWASEPDDSGNPSSANFWSWPGSGIFSVSWAHPSLRYSHCDRRTIELIEIENGIVHYRVPLDPEVAAVASFGIAGGLVMTDDKGQVTEGFNLKGTARPYITDNSSDHYIYTANIQDPNLRPYIEIETGATDLEAPGMVGKLIVTGKEPLEPSVSVSFTDAADRGGAQENVLGYEVRYAPVGQMDWNKAARLALWEVPKPDSPGTVQKMRITSLAPGKYTLAVRALDFAGNAGEWATVHLEMPSKAMVTLEKTPAIKLAASAEPVVLGDVLEVWAVDDLVKVNPLDGTVIVDSQNYVSDKAVKLANNVWSGADNKVSLVVSRGEVVAFQLVLGRKSGAELKDIKVGVSNLKGNAGTVASGDYVDLYRLWYMDVVPRKEEQVGPWELVEQAEHNPAWHPDACLPLKAPFDDTFDIPSSDNIGPSQQYQSVLVDIFIPPSAMPGLYNSKVTISVADKGLIGTVNLEVRVLPISFPQQPSWVIDLNCYDYGIQNLMKVSRAGDYDRYLGIEKKFYQMAKAHRAQLNALPYNQNGGVDESSAPQVEVNGTKARLVSFDKWEQRFGDYFSGKAFTREQGYTGPGQGLPMTHHYIPFQENWPLPLKENYGDYKEVKTRLDFAEWAKTSRPGGEAFSEEYREGVIDAASQFFRHLKKRGYTKTAFQVYYNNKYYFKVPFFGEMREGTGTSFWLLDEPVDYDDYAINGFFMGLIQKGYEKAKVPDVKLDLRTDVSMPEMTRGLWDGICNMWTTSGLTSYGPTMAWRTQRVDDGRYWEYGGGMPMVSGRLSDYQMRLFNRWCLGTDGHLPYWDVLRGEGWFRPSDLAIFYPGTRYARSGKDYDGPLAGFRLKALRRVQEDIEYLNMLAAKPGWNRLKVKEALRAWADDPAAPQLTFANLTLDDIYSIRRAVVSELMKK